jgi:hypothetical protein
MGRAFITAVIREDEVFHSGQISELSLGTNSGTYVNV